MFTTNQPNQQHTEDLSKAIKVASCELGDIVKSLRTPGVRTAATLPTPAPAEESFMRKSWSEMNLAERDSLVKGMTGKQRVAWQAGLDYRDYDPEVLEGMSLEQMKWESYQKELKEVVNPQRGKIGLRPHEDTGKPCPPPVMGITRN